MKGNGKHSLNFNIFPIKPRSRKLPCGLGYSIGFVHRKQDLIEVVIAAFLPNCSSGLADTGHESAHYDRAED